MKKKTNYHITYSVDNELKHYFTNIIVNAREFISNNFSSVLSCWREIKTKKKSSIERIFRNRKETLLLSERIYKCEVCKIEIDRDLNASINIKNSGIKIPEVTVEEKNISSPMKQ